MNKTTSSMWLLYREICGMAAATSWRSAPAEISQALWSKLSTLYATPNDIDLYPAGLAETKLPGAHTGPTFSCIIGRQGKMKCIMLFY